VGFGHWFGLDWIGLDWIGLDWIGWIDLAIQQPPLSKLGIDWLD
jgi:hypothetical protein